MYYATKAFDRVDFCILFTELLKRDIPVIYIVYSVAKFSWNGVCSEGFRVVKGVKQGGIVSPILFWGC